MALPSSFINYIEKKFFLRYIHKKSKNFLKFDEIEIKKLNFHSSKNPRTLENLDVDKILISDEFTYGKYRKDGDILLIAKIIK